MLRKLFPALALTCWFATASASYLFDSAPAVALDDADAGPDALPNAPAA